MRFFPWSKSSGGTLCLALTPHGVAFAQVQAGEGRTARVRACGCHPAGEAVKGRPCVVLLHPVYYALLPMEPPREIPRAEWASAMRWQVADRLDFPADEALIELFEVPRGGQPGLLYVAAGRAQELTALARSCARQQGRLLAMGIWELALTGLISLLTGDAEVHGLLYLDPQVSLLVIAGGGTLYLARRLLVGEPTGADDLAREVERGVAWFEQMSGRQKVNSLFVLATIWETGRLQRQLRQRLGMPILDCLESLGPLLDQPMERELLPCLPAMGAAWRHETGP